jgi:hypothetical protein
MDSWRAFQRRVGLRCFLRCVVLRSMHLNHLLRRLGLVEDVALLLLLLLLWVKCGRTRCEAGHGCRCSVAIPDAAQRGLRRVLLLLRQGRLRLRSCRASLGLVAHLLREA